MIWIVLTLMLLLITLYHGLEYYRARQTWRNLTQVKGQLLAYQLNPKSKKVNQTSFVHSTHNLERMSKKPTVLYSYEYQGKAYQNAKLCLLDEVETEALDLYLSPKPVHIDVYLNPENPNEAVLHFGRLSTINVLSSYVAVLFFVYFGHRYFG